ncbi:unnamed protein product [Euphydryas editha]|uniref:Uncharacterized protein n=1 Tax=Euphydryas editha TaxID=104508 RepID=A0AAU9TG92_EUPED|nr:unnamed protein product [Euphydryas editha]
MLKRCKINYQIQKSLEKAECDEYWRYGVVEGRFCFEGGSHCGKGEGLHMLITDQAQDITDAFDHSAQGNFQQRIPAPRSSGTERRFKSRPNTRLSDFNTGDQSIQDNASALYEENYFGEDCGDISPYWPSAEKRGYDDTEYKPDTGIDAKPPWSGADHVTLERCNNCLTKLGGVSRTSTVALNTGTNFNPAWTMEAVPESCSDNSSNSTEYHTPKSIRKDPCQCKEKPPQRPPKPAHFDQKKPPAPLPSQGCSCHSNENFYPISNPKVGPYENYDVPKASYSGVISNQSLKASIFERCRYSALPPSPRD